MPRPITKKRTTAKYAKSKPDEHALSRSEKADLISRTARKIESALYQIEVFIPDEDEASKAREEVLRLVMEDCYELREWERGHYYANIVKEITNKKRSGVQS